ncbi:hypothetical protein ACHAW5_009193 [Stephanodiscus triporus]|uniref:WSC domain-containing protein n=1 Tax=Stephanodiscus triporus TaxID=2934178 RepID=A0ABD3N344_9STRA
MKLPSIAFIALLAAAYAKSDEDEYFYPRRQNRRRINRVRIQNRDANDVGSIPTPAPVPSVTTGSPVMATTDEPTESPTNTCDSKNIQGTGQIKYIGKTACVDAAGNTFAYGELKNTQDNFQDCANACTKLGLTDLAGIDFNCGDETCNCLLNGSTETKAAQGAANPAFKTYVAGSGEGYPVKGRQVKAKLQPPGHTNNDVLCGSAQPKISELIFVKEA